MRLAIALLLVAPATARADEPDRPLHGNASAGGALLLTGAGGDRQRGELSLDVEPYSRYGAVVAWRHFDRGHHGLVTAGLVYEGGAARPRIVVDLHADAGVDLDQRAPVVGGGLHTIIALIGPLGVGLDTGGYLVVDGVSHTRLAIATGAAIAATW